MYRAIVKLWEDAWTELVPFPSFGTESHKVICSANAIESVNACTREAVRGCGHFPDETAAPKRVHPAPRFAVHNDGRGRRRPARTDPFPIALCGAPSGVRAAFSRTTGKRPKPRQNYRARSPC
ncbi:transposase [Streptomyces kebangsaanensis]|uniref:transposase n=1 Tax=Streptomyces kebangsaanensis TaxID=864058 RepID=UPI0009A0AC45